MSSGRRGLPAASTAMKRGSRGGTLTRAKNSLPVPGLRTTTARLSERPEMYGNGWAGSTASGVSTGKIWRRKNRSSRFFSESESSPKWRSWMPSSASAGLTSSWNTRAWRSASSWALMPMPSRTWRGVSPEAAVTASPVAMRRFRPATRTMKNSSRLEAKIARNQARSSSGSPVSSACSITRWLNASQLSSRSANRPSGSGSSSAVPSASSLRSSSPTLSPRMMPPRSGRAGTTTSSSSASSGSGAGSSASSSSRRRIGTASSPVKSRSASSTFAFSSAMTPTSPVRCLAPGQRP